ncbi:hypothetical protein IU443_16745 [Nocardia farcinica]|uniref:Uncharacterized protein n=1 Tax=Nocardia farcinica TaxID=37329 RepID=A0A0H5P8W0_NOCFR|nr:MULTISPECIES: hypothetical protein [Nocardia]MBA4858618.1 hypothetical protein [Nocardia farcinica]MBC9815221.1 hypothetical protein [Nocardia farcinica]MBF6072351.1 hypothetical protein [Nocardia farcinica]MBF6141467.1 hypothetical protein [Nocardia farcinica]MBF6185267.1 hypothetical protein [Nocardia farcinica]
MAVRVGRVMIRGLAAAALGSGAVLAIPQTAAADGPCPVGTASVFLNDATHHCQGAGTTTYTARPAVAKVCAMSGTAVTVDSDGARRVNRQHIELDPGHCTRLEIGGQYSATVQVSPR